MGICSNDVARDEAKRRGRNEKVGNEDVKAGKGRR
jgi:hypothetical protein